MTNFTFLTNLFGQRSEKTTRQSGHTLESIVSRFSLVSLICACLLTLGAGNVWGDDFTWNLADASYSSSSTTDVVWSNANATMTLSKGSSSTNANNYLGGGSNSHTRMYKDQTLTFTPMSGVTITSVEITATSNTYASNYSGANWTNATGSSSESVATITPTDGTTAFYGVIGTATRATQIKVYYTTGGISTYSVTYNGNDNTTGTVPSDNTAYSSGATVTVLGNTGSLEKTGYSFGNWNTSADGSGTSYAAGNTFSITGNTTLYAKWTATITLNGNGATTNGSANATVNYKSSSISAITNPSKTDYIFAGWYSDAGGTGSLVINTSGALQANVSGFTGAGGIWTATEAKMLYAKWLAAAGERYQLVTDVSDLESGDEIIILDTNGSCALSTDQRSNNRAGIGSNAAIWTISSNIVTVIDPDQVQVLTISPGSTNSSYWQLYTGSGYLYAAGSSNNYLKTQGTNNVNGEWNITIESSVASIVATGSSNRNVMQYNYNNNNPPIFTCYETASQTALKIYKKACNNPGTALSFTLSPSSITTGGSSTLTASDGNGGIVNWSITSVNAATGSLSAATGSSVTFSASAAGTYTIKASQLKNGEYCSQSVTHDIVVTAPAVIHTVTLKDDNTELPQASIGASITLPTRTGCEGYTFAGWTKSWTSHQTNWTTTAPTIISAGSYTPEDDENLYPVYTKTEGGGAASLTKMVTGNTLTNGDKIVVVANGTDIAMYQETVSSSYVQTWDCSTLNVSTVSADDKNWWDVTATDGGFHLGDATNGYLNNSANNLYCNASQSVWTLSDLGNGTFKLQADGRNLSYRSDLATTKWRMGGASYGTSGNTILEIYKYSPSGSTTTSYISVPDCNNFVNGKTYFIQAESTSAWYESACVKAWFNNSGSGGSAQSTYWLFDATDGDAGKKLFATIVPASGILNQVTLQRFASDCLPENFYNNNGTLTKASSNGSNTFRSTGSGTNNIFWNASGVTLYLYGAPNSWASSLATFDDQGGGEWTATYSDYTPSATSADFKIYASYEDWIGNTNSNNNATLSDMIVGSTYDVLATLDVTDHSLVITKTYVKGTVHFDLQGHGEAIADLTNVLANAKISAPTTPTADGWAFGGWYKEAGCTNAWNFATDEVTETMTLYAKWTAKTATTVTLSEAGVESPASGSHYVGDSYTLPSSTTAFCGDKELVGWSTIEVASTDTKPASNFYELGETVTLGAGTNKYYAVFAAATMGGGAAVNAVLFSEDFSGYSANNVPSGTVSNSHTGTTVYNSGSVTYSCTNGTGTTKIFAEALAGGTSPELLVGKSNGTFTISGIPTGGASEVTISYNQNAYKLKASVSGEGYDGTHTYNTKALQSFDIVCGSAETFSLTFEATSTSNVRLDNIEVIVKAQGIAYTGYTTSCGATYVLTFKETDGTENGSGRVAEDATFFTYISEPSNEGQQIEGFYAENTLTTKIANPDLTFVSSTIAGWLNAGKYDKDANADLYLKWETKHYTITYLPGANGTGTVAAGDKTHGVDFTLSSSTFTRAGFTQDGWSIADGGAKIYNLGATYTDDADITLYPHWIGEACTITWTVNNKPWTTGTPDTSVEKGTRPTSIPTAPTTGHCDGEKIFVGWSATPIPADPATGTNIRPKDLFTSKSAAPVINTNTTFYAVFATPSGSPTQFDLFTEALTEGEYILCYDGKALNTTTSSNRLQYEEVTINGTTITNSETNIIWYLYQDGGYWQIYNTTAGYASSTGTKNQAGILLDPSSDKTKWTESGTTTHDFVNKYNTANSINAYLRNNGTYGFACYAAGTGGALSLYKRNLTYSGYVTTCEEKKVPYLTATPASLNFGTVAQNASVTPQTITISGDNLSSATITITAPAGFSVSPTTITVSGDLLAATDLTVTPVTTNTGTFSGNLTIACAGVSTINIPLTVTVSPVYTVTLHNESTESGTPETSSIKQTTPGAEIHLPIVSPSATCLANGWVFAGWKVGGSQSSTTSEPTLITDESYTPEGSNKDLYAVYKQRSNCDVTTDDLEQGTTDATDYTFVNWSGKTVSSSAVYAGNSAGDNSSIQLRSVEESGIVSTTSGGVVSKIVVIWNNATVTGRTLQIYGKNEPYTSASELYEDEKGTLLGTIVKGSSTTLNISKDFAYIGIRSKEGTLYATSISVDWSTNCTNTWNSNPSCNPCTEKPTVGGAALVGDPTNTTAVVKCTSGITAFGGSEDCLITSYGYCWGTSSTPNLTDYYYEIGTTYTTTGTPFANYTITGLTPGGHYCVRPYATNGKGTAYGTATCFDTDSVAHITFGVPNGVDAPQTVTLDAALPYADVPVDCGNCWVFIGWTTEDTWDSHSLPSPLYEAGHTADSYGIDKTTKLNAVYKRDFYRMLTYAEELSDAYGADFDHNYYVITAYTGEESGEWAMDATSVYTYYSSGWSGYNIYYAPTTNIDDILHLEYGNYSIFNPQPENIWHLEGCSTTGTGKNSSATAKVYNNASGKKYIRLYNYRNPIVTATNDESCSLTFTSNNEAGLAASFNIYNLDGSDRYCLVRGTYNNKPAYTCEKNSSYHSGYVYKRVSLDYKTIPECPKYTVTWKVNGATVRTDYVSRCEGVPTPPASPSADVLEDCGANGFVGWSATRLGHEDGNTMPKDIFTRKEDAPELLGNMTFHAVFGTADGYEYVGDDQTIRSGEKYLFVSRNNQGSGYALNASGLREHTGSSITAPAAPVTVGTGNKIAGILESYEFYIEKRKADYSWIQEVKNPSRYLYIDGNGIGYREGANNSRAHYNVKRKLHGWSSSYSGTSYYRAYYTNNKFSVGNGYSYAYRKVYTNFKTACYEEWPATVIEWGQNKVIIDLDTTATVIAKAKRYDVQIGTTHTAKMALVQTKTSYKGYASPRTYTIDGSSKFTFTGKAGETLVVNWFDENNDQIGYSHIFMPTIVATSTTLSKNHEELHVLPGATLTANAEHEIGQLEVYPGATVFITGSILHVDKFILRAGWSRIDGTNYDAGRVDIHPSGSLYKSHAYMDWYLDWDKYYPIAVPFPVAVNEIVYKNEKFSAATTRSAITLLYYDGDNRAQTNQSEIGENWKEYSPLPTNLEPGKGYAFTAKRPSGRAFSIIRMPMNFTNTWTTNGEKGVVSGSQKNSVTVTKYKYANTIWMAMGWNFIANPYMALYNGNYLTGTLEEQEGGNVRYATIPTIDFQDYYQVDIEEADLKPGSGFFIQAGGTDGETQNLIFASDGRKHMPARTMRGTMDDQEVFIRLSQADKNDQMGIIVGEDYTEEYEVNADLVKFMSTNDNSLKSYLRYNDMDLAYIALSPELAKEWIPVIVRVPAAGEYTYSLKESSSKTAALEAVWLLDGLTGRKTNLLVEEYTFHAAEPGSISGRFSINAIVRGEETPTGIGYLSDDDDKCVKFILNDHIYLRCNGMIYDMTGKTVELPVE